MNYLEKLDHLMEINGLNKSTLSAKSGIPYTTIDGWYKKGYEGAKLSTIQKLADFFDTTLDYLMRDGITDIHYGKSDGFKVSYEEMNCIKKYRALDEHGKDIIDTLLQKEYDHIKKHAAETADEFCPGMVFLHFPCLPVSAGTGVYLDGDDADILELPATAKNSRANFALRVSGDSMEPDYHDGDIILVRTQPEVKDGELGIFVLNGEGYFKKWRKRHLVSLNSKYEDKAVADYDDFHCMGKVIGKAEQ